ncbi:hypothetical protein ACTL6P_12080 [Endozoicomonas acroporae]|uniref:hypothetical protein n=1 Tax=Endozoicomonas acroporae TaxID=1701104 RepID=UPI0023EA7593|nr:hypothetical protein [Endozoicomonas acroporae]
MLVAELMSHKGKKLSELVSERIALFPSSVEINSTLGNPQAAIDWILSIYEKDAVAIDHTDGISLDMSGGLIYDFPILNR